jgi:transcriptional regulator with XRE-family HTH domain
MKYFDDIAKSAQYTRIQRKVDQATAAEESGISLRTVQNIEAGKPANTSSLFAYLDYLGLLADMLGTLPDPNKPTPLEMLSAQKKKEHPQRIRNKAASYVTNTPIKSGPNKKQFTWGDEK